MSGSPPTSGPQSPPPDGSPGGTIPGEEVKLSNNRFGTVTNLAVRYNAKKGLLSGIHVENLTLRHVVAVRLETSRHAGWGIVLVIIGLACFAGRAAGIVPGLLFIAIGVFLVWGWPKVVVTAADGQPRPSVSWPWTRSEADAFVKAVSYELMSRG
jgi:hypothetical protein